MGNKTKPCAGSPECFRNTDPWSDGGITHIAVCPSCGERFKTSRNHTLPIHDCKRKK